MRASARSLGAWIITIALFVAAALAFFLGVGFPYLVGDEAFRESLGAALGSELRYANIEIAYFPPTIILESPTLGGVDGFAHADRAILEVSVLPMLARVVLVDSAVVEGAVVTLVRSGEGVRLVSGTENDDPNAAPRDTTIRFAARSLTIADALLVLEDRTVSPEVRWELERTSLQLQTDTFDLEPSFTISGYVATGGRISADGQLKSSGEFDARIRLVAVSIAPARSYFASEANIGGSLTGTINAGGSYAEFDLDLSEGELMLGEIALRGPLKITGKIATQNRLHEGLVEVDATEAELRFGDFFTKPPGTRGRVRGAVTSDAEGTLAIDGWKFEMDDFQGRV